MSGRTAIRIPAVRRTQSPDAALATPWFARDGKAVLGSAPALLTFDDSDFLAKFLAGVDLARGGWVAGAFPLLRPVRDWSEAPRAMRDAMGSPRFDDTAVRRRALLTGEALGEAGVGASAVLQEEQNKSGLPWLRKLYLPTHRHFHVVAIELVCERPDRPPIDPARVGEAGAVIRRLIPDSGAETRWEDWVPAGEGKGTWVEIADASMRGANERPLDPSALAPLADGDTDLRTRLGLGPSDRLPALRPVRLMPLPPAQAAGHNAMFGFVPVMSADLELAVDGAGLATNAAYLRAEAEQNLDADLGARVASLRDRVKAAWQGVISALGSATVGGWGARPSSPSSTPFRTGLWNEMFPVVPPALPHTDAETPPLPINLILQGILRGIFGNRQILADVMRAVATAAVASSVTVPDFASGASTSVVGRWRAATGVRWSNPPFSNHPAELAELLRETLYEALDDALTIDPAAPGSAAVHELVAAVLLWVRNHRIQLAKAQRALLSAVIPGGAGEDPEVRVTFDPHAPDVEVPLVTVGSLAGEIEAFLVADEARAGTPRLWPVLNTTANASHIAVHRAALELEDVLAEITRLGGGGGGGWVAAVDAKAAALRSQPAFARTLGLDLDGQPEQGILVLRALNLPASWTSLRTAALDHYTAAATANDVAIEAIGRQTVIRPRFDPDHIYAVWAFARVRDGDPCVNDRIVWSDRTEPFAIADAMDVLGLKPVPIRLPDLPNLLRDLPRIARAGALPVAAVTTPPDSGYATGDDPAQSARQWGVAWVCSFGIPVFTLCAWILFSIIFSVLLAIPGFAWMLLLKICIPVPAPRRS